MSRKKRRLVKHNQFRKVPPARPVDIAGRLAALRLVAALFPPACPPPQPQGAPGVNS